MAFSNLFKITFYDYDEQWESYPMEDFAHVRANVEFADDLLRAYANGCSRIGGDILSRDSKSPFSITYSELIQIVHTEDVEQRGYTDDSEIFARICDEFEAEDYVRAGAEGIHRRDLWCLITLIGNRELTLTIPAAAYPSVDIGGSFPPFTERTLDQEGVCLAQFERADFFPILKYVDSPELTQFKIQWGHYLGPAWLYAYASAKDEHELISAYRSGVSITGIDIKNSDCITIDNFAKLKTLAQPGDLDYYNGEDNEPSWEWAPRTWDKPNQFQPEQPKDNFIIHQVEYFILWRSIARIGLPSLTIEVIEDPAPEIDIG